MFPDADTRAQARVGPGLATPLSIAISWQLNAAPYLCGIHKPCPLLREETMPAVCTHVVNPPTINWQFACALASFLCAHAYIIRKGVLRNGQ